MTDPLPKCPTCGTELPAAPTAPPSPFCSPRCKLVDLGNWMDGRYVVAEALPFDEAEGLEGIDPGEHGE